MKFFWAWQSDTPSKTGRHFVRKALEEAIAELKQSEDIEEPSERERTLHLDHDRKGVAGSPDLARTIMNKISRSTVFIGDVTPIGIKPHVTVAAEIGSIKKPINSNVAIELGYALGVLGDQRLVMVMNLHYGKIEDLPFDLRHKAGPNCYNLPPTATRDQIDLARRELKGRLVVALRPYLQSVEFDRKLLKQLRAAEDRSSKECANRTRYTVLIAASDRVAFHGLLERTVTEATRLDLTASIDAAKRCIAEFQDNNEWIKVYHRFRVLIQTLEDECRRRHVAIKRRRS